MKFVTKHQIKKPRYPQEFEKEYPAYEGKIIEGTELVEKHESRKLKIYESIQAQNAFVTTPEILMASDPLEREKIEAKHKRSSYRADISDIPEHSADIAKFLDELVQLDKDILKGMPVKAYLKDRIATETAKQNAKAKKQAELAEAKDKKEIKKEDENV